MRGNPLEFSHLKNKSPACQQPGRGATWIARDLGRRGLRALGERRADRLGSAVRLVTANQDRMSIFLILLVVSPIVIGCPLPFGDPLVILPLRRLDPLIYRIP